MQPPAGAHRRRRPPGKLMNRTRSCIGFCWSAVFASTRHYARTLALYKLHEWGEPQILWFWAL